MPATLFSVRAPLFSFFFFFFFLKQVPEECRQGPEAGVSAYLHPRANTAGSPSSILDLVDRRSCVPIIGHGMLRSAL